MIDLSIFRVSVAIAILAYATYTDIKTRTVPPKAWVVMGIAGIPLLIIDGIYNGHLLLLLFIVALVSSLAYLGYRLGVYQGGDAKGFMALSILCPSMVIGTIFNAFILFSVIFIWAILLTQKVPQRLPFMPAIFGGFIFRWILGTNLIWYTIHQLSLI